MEDRHLVKAYIAIPPLAKEQSASYKHRIAGYLYDLLHGVYRGKAHEVDTGARSSARSRIPRRLPA